jgi:hypothetical protein
VGRPSPWGTSSCRYARPPMGDALLSVRTLGRCGAEGLCGQRGEPRRAGAGSCGGASGRRSAWWGTGWALGAATPCARVPPAPGFPPGWLSGGGAGRNPRSLRVGRSEGWKGGRGGEGRRPFGVHGSLGSDRTLFWTVQRGRTQCAEGEGARSGSSSARIRDRRSFGFHYYSILRGAGGGMLQRLLLLLLLLLQREEGEMHELRGSSWWK